MTVRWFCWRLWAGDPPRSLEDPLPTASSWVQVLASLDQGCLYFDQAHHHAGRGYGYVGASRFRSREGCFLYGRIRRTDFLPVGEPQEHEVTERGIESESSDEDDVPKCNWGNALSGRMGGYDDDGDSNSSEGEAPVSGSDAEDGDVVQNIDFL